jgi:hypothetical protein
MTTKRQQIAAIMADHPWLEVRHYPKGTYVGHKSQCWEFRTQTTPYRTKAAFTCPDRALDYARQLQAALPPPDPDMPF